MTMPDRMTDQEAYDFYAKPENRESTGPGFRRRRLNLTEHIPVRFDRATIEAVQARADADGVTVSTWIRNVVRKALSDGGDDG